MPDYGKMVSDLAQMQQGNSMVQPVGDVVPFPGSFVGTQQNNGKAPFLSLSGLSELIKLQQKYKLSDRQLIEALATARGQLGYR